MLTIIACFEFIFISGRKPGGRKLSVLFIAQEIEGQVEMYALWAVLRTRAGISRPAVIQLSIYEGFEVL